MTRDWDGETDRPARGALGIMSAPDLVNLSALIDNAGCFALVLQHRWPEGVRCPGCGSASVVRDGYDDTLAVSMNVGPAVLTNSGPPAASYRPGRAAARPGRS